MHLTCSKTVYEPYSTTKCVYRALSAPSGVSRAPRPLQPPAASKSSSIGVITIGADSLSHKPTASPSVLLPAVAPATASAVT